MSFSLERQHAEKKERAPKRVFVEMGTHTLAVPWLGSMKFGPDDLYIGVDIDPVALRTSKEFTKDVRGTRKNKNEKSNMLFVQADMAEMPVKNQSVHEVFIGNVLGDPSISDRKKNHFLSEARRIVAQDGRVVIKENNTPAELDFVRELLEKNHLKVEKFIDSHSPEWNNAVTKYHRSATGHDQIRFKPTDYMVYAVPDTMP